MNCLKKNNSYNQSQAPILIYAEVVLFLFKESILKPSKFMAMAIFVTNVKIRNPMAKIAVAILISTIEGR